MKKLNYVFNNEKLFELAMTQSGADAENNNERLEFLGDRVLGLSVAEMLYKIFPGESEGKLARRFAVLVSTKTLALIAKNFGLEKSIRHGHLTGGMKEHVAADAMESVIGAIYLDGGWESAKKFVLENWTEIAMAEVEAPKDPKTELQEMAQHSGNGSLPVYEFTDCKRNTFCACVTALGQSAEGKGSTKKSATIAAAQKLLDVLKKS